MNEIPICVDCKHHELDMLYTKLNLCNRKATVVVSKVTGYRLTVGQVSCHEERAGFPWNITGRSCGPNGKHFVAKDNL